MAGLGWIVGVVLAAGGAAAGAPHPISDPTSRIERHLAGVEVALRAAPPAGLSSAQAAARADLLGALHAYHLAGVWPQPPAGTPVRARPVSVPGGYAAAPTDTPLFVDAEGRACAVGALLLHAGEDALVASVVAADNGAWLHELDTGRLGAAAAARGMRLDEWAAIQPGYPAAPRPAPPPAPLPPFEGDCEPRIVLERVRALGPAGAPAGYAACLEDRVARSPGRPDARIALEALVRLRRPGAGVEAGPLSPRLLAVSPEDWAAAPVNATLFLRYLRTAPDPAAHRELAWRVVLAARAVAEAAPESQRATREGQARRLERQHAELGGPAAPAPAPAPAPVEAQK